VEGGPAHDSCLRIVFPNPTDSIVSIGSDVKSPIYDNTDISKPTPSAGSDGQIWKVIAIFGFGVTFVVSILSLAFIFPQPTPFQYTVCRIILALAASGVATLLPGTLDVTIPGYVTASAAFAVFVIVYFRTPAELVTKGRTNQS
jgi:hypothetical protein